MEGHVSNVSVENNNKDQMKICKFAVIGCEFKGNCADLRVHYAKYSNRHLQQAYKGVVEYSEELNLLRKNIDKYTINTSDPCKEDLESLQRKYKDLENSFADNSAMYVKELNDMCEKKVKLERKHASMIKKASKKCSDLEKELQVSSSRYKAELDTKAAEFLSKYAYIHALETKIIELQLSGKEKGKENSPAMQNLMEGNKNLKKTVETICQAYIKNNYDSLHNQLKHMEGKFKTTECELKKLQSELETNKQKVVVLQDKCKNLEAEFKQKKDQVLQYKENAEMFKKANKQLRSMLEKYSGEVSYATLLNNAKTEVLKNYWKEEKAHEDYVKSLEKSVKTLELNEEDKPKHFSFPSVEIKEPVKNMLTYNMNGIHDIMTQTKESLKEYAFLSEEFYTSVPGYRCQFRVVVYNNMISFDFRVKQGKFDDYLNWPFRKNITLQVNSEVLNFNQRLVLFTLKSCDMALEHVCKPSEKNGNPIFKNENFINVRKYIQCRNNLLFDLVIE